MPIGSDKGSFIKPGFLPLTVGPSSKRFAWGSNVTGRLGDGTTTNYSSPIQVGTDTWTHLESMYNAGGGVKEAGTLWMWGNNNQGRLGDGTTTVRSSPVQVGSGTNWTSTSGGARSTMGIRAT